ncbi:MAG: DUF6438 domain-containing protein [Chitinophagaceae bacterium]
MKPFLACITLLLSHTSFAATGPSYQELIQGEWMNEMPGTPARTKNERFCISFEKNTCSSIFTWGDYAPYSIKENVLTIKDIRLGNDKYTFSFTIAQLTDSLLTLYLLNKFSRIPDTLHFFRAQIKNKIIPGKINFYSSGCFGTCPSMYVEIDTSGNILFYGLHHAKKDGGYRGTIPAEDYNVILRLINHLPVDSIKPGYNADWTDDQTCSVKISYSGKSLSSSAYGFNKEPMELRLLFHKLTEVYKNATLVKDAGVTKAYFDALKLSK